jgi:pimeloyl-ACP methyl ester carboxylesterase
MFASLMVTCPRKAVGMAPLDEVQQKDATVFGYKMHYREAGKGPAVILLHGLGGDGSRWGGTMDALSDDCRVIALDQIGFGESDKPLVNYNHALLAEFLIEFMNVVEIPKASIVGHSMGAFVGNCVAVHYPDRLERLVLVDGGSLQARPRSAHLVQIQNGTTLAETREYFGLMFFDKSRVTDQLVRDNYIRRLRASYTISRMQEARAKGLAMINAEEAARIQTPTLIIWGKHDELLPAADAELLERTIPNSRLVMLEKCGHIPQVEQPDEFHRALQKFLTATATDASARNDR